jgi:glycosyltransferase involved in cell wall biosynthesis
VIPASVSIILPTYDRLPLLREAIASVFAQTRSDWQLVVVDDGSRDGTADYLAALGDPRVAVVTVAHCGSPARLRNLGMAQGTAPLVAFLDSDDVWLPSKLERQLEALAAHPACGWSYTAPTLIDGAGAPLPAAAHPLWRAFSGQIVPELLTHDARIACPTVIARRELVGAAGGFDEAMAFSEDYDLWLRFARRSAVWAVAEPLTEVRIHAGNTTRGRPEVNLAFVAVYEKFRRDLDAGSPWRRLCDRQRALYWLHYGRQMWQRGAGARAALALAQAFRLAPTHPALWSAVSGKLARAFGAGSPSARATSADSDARETR